MLFSMTGFGHATSSLPGEKITVEVKCLNSKTADIATRLPQRFRDMDLEIRRVIAKTLVRGKIDVTISVENDTDTPSDSHIHLLNIPAVKAYKKQIEEMSRQLGIPEPDDWYAILLRCPNAFIQPEIQTVSYTPDEAEAIVKTLGQALEAASAFRNREGDKLMPFFTERISIISNLLAQVPQFENSRVEKVRQRITEHLEHNPHPDIDQARLEQELIFYIEKFDITEEKQRLSEHLRYFLETLASPPGQGKTLGFIAQEIGREINTLGSKSNNADMQRLVVKMKDELEQIKEQVLNVL